MNHLNAAGSSNASSAPGTAPIGRREKRDIRHALIHNVGSQFEIPAYRAPPIADLYLTLTLPSHQRQPCLILAAWSIATSPATARLSKGFATP